MLKKPLLLLCFVLICLNCSAQLKSKVDERVELTTVVFRLAGIPEYIHNDVKVYADNIDEYFADYTDHPLLNYIGQIRREYLIGYDAIAGTATHIEIKNGNVILSEKINGDFVSFDKRWTEEAFYKYIELLNDFYVKSDFRRFFESQSDIYEKAKTELDKILLNVNPDWFESFYGVPFTAPDVYVAVGNGKHNYQLMDPGSDTGFAIAIGYSVPLSGSVFTMIIHEINHIFSNPLSKRYWPEMGNAANAIYRHVEKEMMNSAYGSSYSMAVEWINNLFMLMYLKDNSSTIIRSIPYELWETIEKGFIWMPESYQFMDNYYSHSARYGNISDFMPQLAGFLNHTALGIDNIVMERSNRTPFVTSIYPAPGSNILNCDQIVFKFSKAMQGSHGIAVIPDYESMNIMALDSYWADEYTFVININKDKLVKNKEYGLQLQRYFFLSTLNYPVSPENISVIYNTFEK